MRTRIPHFRVPEAVVDEEVAYILDAGIEFRSDTITSMQSLLAEGWDAVFVGSGAPRGLDLELPGRVECIANIHIGTDWLAGVFFKHIRQVHGHVVVIGGGNSAIDCARTARRIGADRVTVVNRGPRLQMRAATWEQEEAEREGVKIRESLSPKSFLHHRGKLVGVEFESVLSLMENGRRKLVPTSEPPVRIDCDKVILAVGQEAAFPWIERDIGILFDWQNKPVIEEATLQSTHPKVFFGGDAAFGAKNIVTAVAHGREAAVSIDLILQGADPSRRPSPFVSWSPGSIKSVNIPPHIPEVSEELRHAVPHLPPTEELRLETEVELGFEIDTAIAESQRCLHCESQTLYETSLCVECKACETVCPTRCITFTKNGEEAELRTRLKAPATNMSQALLAGDNLISGRIMIRNEDICLHCGLCAENCPTGAWRIEELLLKPPHAGIHGATSLKENTHA